MTQQESNWTEVDLWAEIHRLRAAVKGPEGYASWQDAAIAERVRRLKAETPLTEEEARELRSGRPRHSALPISTAMTFSLSYGLSMRAFRHQPRDNGKPPRDAIDGVAATQSGNTGHRTVSEPQGAFRGQANNLNKSGCARM